MVAALRDERYAAGSPPNPHIRELARSKFSPARLAIVADEIERSARRLLDELAGARSFELVADFARPWSREVARSVTGIVTDGKVAAASAQIFAAAVEPLDDVQQARAVQATAVLAPMFSGESLALDLQAFVALSETLPCLIANSFCALLEFPDQLGLLRDAPNAIEELLRYAGPSRAILRRNPESGDRVLLMLADANRDPDVFPDPDRLNLSRDASGHVGFGAGAHACVGAPLIRMALKSGLRTFVEHMPEATIAETPEWLIGTGIKCVTSLKVSA